MIGKRDLYETYLPHFEALLRAGRGEGAMRPTWLVLGLIVVVGAVALVLASARRARELRVEPLGRVRSWAFAGCDPAQMGLGPRILTVE